MATADEKQAKQDARDAARQSVTVGQQRLATEVNRAAAAFPQRRLRSAGDLSRYAIGGFLSDPNAAPPPPSKTGSGATGRVAPTATGSRAGSGTTSGSGLTSAPRPGGSAGIPRLAPKPTPIGTVAGTIKKGGYVNAAGAAATLAKPKPKAKPVAPRRPSARRPGGTPNHPTTGRTGGGGTDTHKRAGGTRAQARKPVAGAGQGTRKYAS